MPGENAEQELSERRGSSRPEGSPLCRDETFQSHRGELKFPKYQRSRSSFPLYNKGLYIARTLNLVLAPTVQDFEVIMVDADSTGDGAEGAKRFDEPRIRLTQQEKRWIKKTRTEMIVFLDAGDESLLRPRVKDQHDRSNDYPDNWVWEKVGTASRFVLRVKFVPS